MTYQNRTILQIISFLRYALISVYDNAIIQSVFCEIHHFFKNVQIF